MTEPVRRIHRSKGSRLFAASFLLMLIALEAGARLVEPRLPAPKPWGFFEVRAQFAQMTALGTSGSVPVVFAGTSQTRWAISSATLALSSPWASYNAAFSAGSPFASEPWLRGAVVPKLHPRTVLIGVSPLDFANSGPRNQARGRFAGAPWTARDVFARAGSWLRQDVALVGHGAELRDPITLVRAIGGRPPAAILPEVIDSSGRAVPDCRETFVRNLTTEREISSALSGTNSLATSETLALGHTISWLRKRHIDTVMLMMPTAPAFEHLLADRRMNVDVMTEEIRHLAAQQNVPLVDITRSLGFDATSFRDYSHLTCSSAELFTRALLGRLGPLQPGAMAPVLKAGLS